jgi:hypothetical protein
MLLNRFNLNIAKLASKEVSRFTLSAVHVTPKQTGVTDGHSMMIVSTIDLPGESFPNRTDSGLTVQDNWKPFNLSSEQALRACADLPKKSTIPVLGCAAVAVNGDPLHPTVLTTDLERHAAYPAMESANFPDWERVLPKKADATFTIGLDARKLKPIIDQFIGFCDSANKRSAAAVTFRFQDATSAVVMEAKDYPGADSMQEQTMTGVLMPLRIPETEKPYDLARIDRKRFAVDRLMREYQDSTDGRRTDILGEVSGLYAS